MEKKTLGVMIDCSRNAVMNVKSIKRFIDLLSAFGYNMLQLYTEDTYEIAEEPYFGYMRGRYTADEIKEIDRYAGLKGIELVPCIQTLAHLNAITRWAEYHPIIDCNDILLADDERTYLLIDRMFNALSKNFTSRRVNIGMDEAHMVGLGKYLERNGYKNRFDILLKHLKKVCEIATKYGFKPMMWSDMFFRLLNNGEYYATNKDFNKEIIDAVPKEVELIYWDYYSDSEKHYDNMIKAHKKFNNNIWFAGGLWSWTGYAPHNKYSIRNTKAAIKACNKNGVENIFFTMWGDNGGECSYFSLLPALCYAAEIARGNSDLNSIKAKFKQVTGCEFDKFIMVDLPNVIGKSKQPNINNPSKYMLYNDLFLGLYDSTVAPGDKDKYKTYARRLRNFDKTSPYYYIFDALSALCDLLYTKYDLGLNTRQAYQSGNIERLKEIVKEYTKLSKKIKIFYDKYKALWFNENKPFGFEVIEIRIGGLLLRTQSCRERLEAFIEKRIDRIEELEQKLLNVYGNNEDFEPKREVISYNLYQNTATVNII